MSNVNQNYKNKKTDILSEAITEYYKYENTKKALELLDGYIESIGDDVSFPFPFQFKADILMNNDKHDYALEIINDGLARFPNSYELLKRRSEILGFHKNDFENAMMDINNAIVYFESNSNATFTNMPEDIKRYASTKIDLINIRQNLFILRENYKMRGDILDIKENIDKEILDVKENLLKERFNYIELLGIFVAIVGFIFANITKMSKFSSLTDAFEFNLAFSIPLILFILLIKLIWGK